jgi:hypothetical protein
MTMTAPHISALLPLPLRESFATINDVASATAFFEKYYAEVAPHPPPLFLLL